MMSWDERGWCRAVARRVSHAQSHRDPTLTADGVRASVWFIPSHPCSSASLALSTSTSPSSRLRHPL